MNGNIYIRSLIFDDAIAYKELRFFAFKESYGAFSESFEDEDSLPISYFGKLITENRYANNITFGAFFKKKLVGFVSFSNDMRIKALHKSFIHTMYVSPELRGQGVGTLLMDEVIKHARAIPGLEAIFAWVLHSKNGSARQFYIRKDFTSTGFLIENDLLYKGEYIHAECFVYNLTHR